MYPPGPGPAWSQGCTPSPPTPTPHPPLRRYYFYAQAAPSGALLMVELVVRTDAGSAALTFKGQAPELVPQFAELFQNLLLGFAR